MNPHPTRRMHGPAAATTWRGLALRLAGLVAGVGAATVFSGCQSLPLGVASKPAEQHPRNIYSSVRELPREVRRVAVLPLASSSTAAALLDGCEALQPVLLAELNKTKRFEVVPISPESLRMDTGRSTWTPADQLPADFLSVLRQTYNVDAILFAELTEYRAYTPVAVGWRLRLVDTHTGFPIWAGDELYDAGKPEIASAAKQFRTVSTWFSADSASDWAILHSPRRFGEYAAAQILDTLPVR